MKLDSDKQNVEEGKELIGKMAFLYRKIYGLSK
jgi:hypothetical protein